MRLEKIKLAGFKSFVDPTTVEFPSSLVGIVGPNGCGKSNIIDAVRWVMGESSAKQLRGESITDVIFKGSSGRKPVGQASIELIFDNSDGSLGGEYAKYSQISIRRQVTRDAQSVYLLNGVRCRRRDITDVFLGTGLGPRSYSIIEQNMISRVVEAKPEELRAYLEEVAGISKYKERRRETENRIKHTRENLDRIKDIIEEKESQLRRLKRQTSAAKRYKVLREEERLLKSRLLALRWRALDNELSNFANEISQKETELESHHAQLQSINTQLENLHQAKIESNETFNEVQSRYYTIGSEISRIEQSIEHQKEKRQRLEDDLMQTQQAVTEARNSLSTDESRFNDLQKQLGELKPKFGSVQNTAEASHATLTSVEKAMHDWQMEWDAFNEAASKASQIAQVQQTRIQHLEQQQVLTDQRLSKLEEERQALSQDADLSKEVEAINAEAVQVKSIVQKHQEQYSQIIGYISQQREQNQALFSDLNKESGQLRELKGQYASLIALQQAALGQKDEKLTNWLEKHDLKSNLRLAQNLKVEKGWEKAVETVLGSHLEAVCVDAFDKVVSLIDSLEQGVMTFLDVNSSAASFTASQHTLLNDKLQSNFSIGELLNNVYAVESLTDALALRASLGGGESVITRDGIWVGRNWLKVSREHTEKSGIIQREQEIKSLKQAIELTEQQVNQIEQTLNEGRAKIAEFETMREQLQQTLAQSKSEYSNYQAKLQVKQAEINRVHQRQSAFTTEITEQQKHIDQLKHNLQEARHLWENAMTVMEQNANLRKELLGKRDECRQKLNAVREQARLDRELAHEMELKQQLMTSQLANLTQSIERMTRQLTVLDERQMQLTGQLAQDNESPIDQLQVNLDTALEKRLLIEQELKTARKRADDHEHDIQARQKERHQAEEAVQISRDKLEKRRLEEQTLKVKKTTLQEQLAESTFELNELLQDMPEEANEDNLSEAIEKTALRITRLGPINLAAIHEYDQVSERKIYLDKQLADLDEALETLQNAIRKIDKETRHRFKDTFETVNNTFKELFPNIFRGGSAYLEMTGEDLLDTGVMLMAKPPGKNVSSIHLLSGGEKALTAIALVFSLFQLNPAPFCMLDEVDAPLDDANVFRYCNLVKEMSDKVQFIFISHNKSTIEMAQHLTGVTMNEPGVSRIVAVDVDAAVAMAEG